jgi:hypothetical protein
MKGDFIFFSMIRSVRFILFVLLTFPDDLNAQLISNQVNYGTIADDYYEAIKLSDGNYLIGSSSFLSFSGIQSCASNGNYDFWLLKMDINNTILWQQCLGGTEEDNISSLVETEDGHILVCGISNSPVSGNKTVGTNGGSDFWVIKMDLNGNEVWQKNYGTSMNESTPKITAINSNNYILTSYSSYGMDGDKSEESYGGSDYWVLSINGDGDILWDKTIGGIGHETLNKPVLSNSVTQLIYVIGFSESGAGGLKTEESYGSSDVWIVTLDLQGNIVNQKTFGGSNFEQPGHGVISYDGSILLSCMSNSGPSGNKSTENFGETDIWQVHLDVDLNIINQFVYGGDKIDGTLFSKLGNEDELIIGGFSRSSVSGNKSEDSRGFGDAWILSVNYLNGDINWQKTIGGSLYDYTNYLFDEGDYFKVFCSSESPISGDKTVGTFGDYDIWIFDLSKTVGLEENDVLKRQVYPNPSTGFFHVSLLEGEITRVFDLQGKEMALNCESGILDLSPLQNGVYILNVEKKDAEREIIRLVKSN